MSIEQRVNQLDDLQEAINYVFHDRTLLIRALTHKSMASNPHDPSQHNEVLEFLGDAVLELTITDFLYRMWGLKANEGTLTRQRSRLINSRVLSRVGKRLKLQSFIYARPEQTAPERFTSQLLADTLEALIGAVYLDCGDFETTKEWLLDLLSPELARVKGGEALWMDYRSMLQEYIQAEMRRLPEFRLIRESGPDHHKTFEIAIYINNIRIGYGKGYSKKEAAQEASKQALLCLRDPVLRQKLGFQNPPPSIPDVSADDNAHRYVQGDEYPTPGSL